jgi:hypothetical protein
MNPQEVIKQLKKDYPKTKPIDILHWLLSSGNITSEVVLNAAKEVSGENQLLRVRNISSIGLLEASIVA